MHRLIKALIVSFTLGAATVPALEPASAMPMVAPSADVATQAVEPVYYYYYRRYNYYRPRYYYYRPHYHYWHRWHRWGY